MNFNFKKKKMLQLLHKKSKRIITKGVLQRMVRSHILSCVVYVALLSLHFTIYRMVDSKFIQTLAKNYGPDTVAFVPNTPPDGFESRKTGGAGGGGLTLGRKISKFLRFLLFR